MANNQLSTRALAARTRHYPDPLVPLSRTVVSEMLSGARFPRKAAMISFLRACGCTTIMWRHGRERGRGSPSVKTNRYEAARHLPRRFGVEMPSDTSVRSSKACPEIRLPRPTRSSTCLPCLMSPCRFSRTNRARTPALESNFTVLELPGEAPGVVFVEGLIGSIYLKAAEDLERYQRYQEVFERLQSIALSPAESSGLVTRLSQSYLAM